MANDLDKNFAAAAKDLQALTKRPDDEDLLRAYALYKQGTEGDVSGERPGMLAMKDRAKYDAWAKIKGTDSTKAKEQYVKHVARLKKSCG